MITAITLCWISHCH